MESKIKKENEIIPFVYNALYRFPHHFPKHLIYKHFKWKETK